MACSSLADITPKDAADLLALLQAMHGESATDGPAYAAGRSEGHADVAASLRALLDPSDAYHWNLSGLLTRVGELAGMLDIAAMYARAWEREIGAPYVQKQHQIDALVLTTKERMNELVRLREQVVVLTQERDAARIDAADSKEALEIFVHTRLDEAIREEREDCAKIADEQAAGEDAIHGSIYSGIAGSRARSIAAAIRARGGR